LTAGNGTDTFSWTAPAKNGRDISKYGFQISSDNGSTWRSTVNGTLNGETEVLTNSATIATQYKESSYKIRVRAYNEGGWGTYSDISTNGTVAWVKGDSNANSYTSQTAYAYEDCANLTCGSCGLQAQRKTVSREERKYRWYRAGSTPGPYDANWTAYTQFPAFSTVSCANNGSCVESSWTATSVGSFVLGTNALGIAITYTRYQDLGGSFWYYQSSEANDPACATADCTQRCSYTAEYCSNKAEYRVTLQGLKQWRNLDACGGGGGK
jgi:hypothetical protein